MKYSRLIGLAAGLMANVAAFPAYAQDEKPEEEVKDGDIIAVPTIQNTRTCKCLKVPLRRIFASAPIETALAREAVDDPASIEHLLEAAKAHQTLIAA